MGHLDGYEDVHEAFLVQIGMENSAMLDDQLAEVLNGWLSPPIDLQPGLQDDTTESGRRRTYICNPLNIVLSDPPLRMSAFCICNFARFLDMYSPHSPNLDGPYV